MIGVVWVDTIIWELSFPGHRRERLFMRLEHSIEDFKISRFQDFKISRFQDFLAIAGRSLRRLEHSMQLIFFNDISFD